MPTVNCANCGAPLDAPSSARFVSCRHCGSSLEVKRTDSAEWTEMLGKVADETERLREEVGNLRTEQEIERLDREWETRQRDLQERGEDGRPYRPTRGGAAAMAVFLVLFGIFGLCMCSTASRASRFISGGQYGPGGFPIHHSSDSGFGAIGVLFLLAFVAVAVFGVLRTLSKADAYNAEEKNYRARREELLRRLGRD